MFKTSFKIGPTAKKKKTSHIEAYLQSYVWDPETEAKKRVKMKNNGNWALRVAKIHIVYIVQIKVCNDLSYDKVINYYYYYPSRYKLRNR